MAASAGSNDHDTAMIRISTLPVNRDGLCDGLMASKVTHGSVGQGFSGRPISLPAMRWPEACWSVVYACIFWGGLALGLSLSILCFPLLATVAACINIFMLTISSRWIGGFPSDEKIQSMEDHVLRKYVQAHIQRSWTELQVSVGGEEVGCLAHSLSIRCKDDQAPTLLLVHGTGASSTSFSECFDLLAHDFHVLALDLPGFGRSTTELDSTAKGRHILSQTGVVFWVDFIEKFLESQDVQTVILLGHSYGAFISIHFAAKQPQRVSRLILLDSAGIFPTLGKLGCYWAVAFKFSIPQLFRYFLAPVGRWMCLVMFSPLGKDDESRYWFTVGQHPRGWGDRCIADDISLSWFGAYWKSPAINTLLNLMCPVMTVYGEEDGIMPIHQGRMLEELKGIPCIGVPKAGHSPFHDLDAPFLSAVVRDASQSCIGSERTVCLPAIWWHTYVSTFSTAYTSNVIEILYDVLRNSSEQ
tara:strand:- start:106 stop:1518 length:1413 start_codon:yes stop_codon:yes gene_type:complete